MDPLDTKPLNVEIVPEDPPSEEAEDILTQDLDQEVKKSY